MNKKVKHILLFSFVLALVFGLSANAFAQIKTSGLSNHWARKTIVEWDEKGWIESSAFDPDLPATRIQWVKWLNKAFNLTDKAAISFADVVSDSEMGEQIAIAVEAGYIHGYGDGTFRPNDPITREEAAVMIANLFALPDREALTFKDHDRMAEWSKGAIGAVAEQNFMIGNHGKFRPKDPITCAESITVIDRIMKKPYIEFTGQGTYGPREGSHTIPKSVRLNSPDITLQNVVILGDLELGSGIGNGDVFVKNVNVNGQTIVKGGGEHSVHFENTVMLTVVINKTEGTVRIVVEGQSQVGEVVIYTGAKIETTDSSTVSSVTLSDQLPKDTHVLLTGSFETVNVSARFIAVDIPAGSIANLNVDKGADGSQINLAKEAIILQLVANAAISVFGDGNINKAVINAEGVSMDKPAATMEVGKDVPSNVTVTIGGKPRTVTPPPSAPSVVITPLPEDRTPPVLTGAPDFIMVGEPIYLTSNENGLIYLVPSGTIKSKIALDLAVQEGYGASYPAIAGVEQRIDTAWMSPGQWIAVAVDEASNVSIEHRIQVYNNQFYYEGVSVSPNHSAAFRFNKPIFNNKNDLEELKGQISFSTDGGITFNSLGSNDNVRIVENHLWVDFSVKFTGNKNVLKLNAYAVKDADGNVYDREIVTNPFAAGPNLTMLSEHDLNTGDLVKFITDMPTTVYLVPSGVSGTQADFEYAVVQGKGRKAIIGPNEVNVEQTIDTAGLPAGIYLLLAWSGESTYIRLNITSALNNDQVFLDNQTGASNDAIFVTGLQEGDMVKIYDSPGGTVLATGMVASGHTSVTIAIELLEGNFYYLTVQSPGKAESDLRGFVAGAENNPPTAKTVPTQVIDDTTSVTLLLSDLAKDDDENDLLIVESVAADTENITVSYSSTSVTISKNAGATTGSAIVSVIVKDTRNHSITITIPVEVQ